MPVAGPDFLHAYRSAEEAYYEIVQLLQTKYDISNLSDPKLDGYSPTKMFRPEYEQRMRQLKEVIEKLFVNEASFAW
jgi:hypothetical protein